MARERPLVSERMWLLFFFFFFSVGGKTLRAQSTVTYLPASQYLIAANLHTLGSWAHWWSLSGWCEESQHAVVHMCTSTCGHLPGHRMHALLL